MAGAREVGMPSGSALGAADSGDGTSGTAASGGAGVADGPIGAASKAGE
jgi:hypothetical protein